MNNLLNKHKTKLNQIFLYLLDSRLEELIYYDKIDNSIKHILLHDGLVFVTDSKLWYYYRW